MMSNPAPNGTLAAMTSSSFNLFNYTNVFARMAYSSNIDQIRNTTNFESIIRTSTFFNSNFADENFNIFGRIQRTFGKIRASLNSSFNYSKINQFVQGEQSLNKAFTQSFTPGVRTNFRVAPNVSLRYAYRGPLLRLGVFGRLALCQITRKIRVIKKVR